MHQHMRLLYNLKYSVLEVDTLMVDLDSLVIFDPATSTLYAARDLPMAMNGRSLQLTLPENSASSSAASAPSKARKVTAASRKSRKNLSRALKEANARLRKKNGQLKKGKTQADVMRLAQRLKKRM